MLDFFVARDIIMSYDADGHCKRTGRECDLSVLRRPRRLKFSIKEELERVIESQLHIGQELADTADMHIEIFGEFGKGFIKEVHFSPDAFIQMALQLAFFLVSLFSYYSCINFHYSNW